MVFNNCVLAQGPVQRYQESTANGEMLYDYTKNCWFFNHFSVQYNDNGIIKSDTITGTIRFVKDKDYANNGLNEYDFDVRINEPMENNDSFAPAAAADSDESAFFTTDTTIKGLSGTVKYKDHNNANGDTIQTAGDIDLSGNNITKEQTMYLTKLVIFLSVVPFND
jgi:hypothetical protein